MKKFLLLLLLMGFATFVFQCSAINLAEQKEKRERIERAAASYKANRQKLTAKTGASDTWASELIGSEKYRLEPILTLDLERVWLPRPILFFGRISDIAAKDAQNYRIAIETSLGSMAEYAFSTDLKLSLSCDKQLIDRFLQSNPELFKDAGFNNEIVVVASISSIESGTAQDGSDIRTGVGRCEAIEHTKDW